MPGGDLYINNTNSHDTGRYTCNVTNDLDSDVASASLKVIGKILIRLQSVLRVTRKAQK